VGSSTPPEYLADLKNNYSLKTPREKAQHDAEIRGCTIKKAIFILLNWYCLPPKLRKKDIPLGITGEIYIFWIKCQLDLLPGTS
jgi:hypothetical protein